MYNPNELRDKAQRTISGIDKEAKTSVEKVETEDKDYVFGATTGNLITNILKGATKSVEGIVDAGAMAVGLFGVDVDEFVNYDFTSDLFGLDEKGEGNFDTQWGKQLENASLIDNDNFVNQVAEGVGGMLPAIAVNFIPGVGQALSTGAFIGGAVGNASESAFKEGASYEQALGYGALSGTVEGLTEKIGGRVFGKTTEASKTLLGNLLSKSNLDKYVSKGLGKVAYNFASEGVEEVIADVLDPLNKRISGVDKDAKVDWSQLPKTFVVGGTVGAVLDGMQNSAMALANKDKGGKHFVEVANEIETFVNNTAVLENAQQSGKVSQDKLNKISSKVAEAQIRSLNNMSESLQAMTEEQRKECFNTLAEKTPIFNDIFEESGKLKQDALSMLEETETSGLTQNMSAGLMMNRNYIENDVKRVADSHGLQMQISNSNFSGEERTNLAKIYKATKLIGNKAGKPINVVVVKGDENIPNGYISSNGIMYIDERRIKDGSWAKTTAHEITHFIENSSEYKEFAKFVLADKKAIEKAKKSIVGNQYKITEQEIDSAIEKLQKNESLTDKEEYAYTEVVAHITEDLLGNEESINRLARENKSLAQKILNRIKDFIKAFKGTNADSKVVARLEKAQTLFENALDKLGQKNKENEKHKFSRAKLPEVDDFDSVASLDKWFDSLSFEELQEIVNEIDEDTKGVVLESLPISKNERREQFVKRLYEQGKLNQLVTKIVKSKPQMEKYFSNTKMNNKYNPLIPSKSDEYVVMFHGTPEQFNVFDTKKVGKHGSVMGSGIYFTANYSYAEDYKEYDDGRVIATLLDIKKPLSRNKHDITKEQLKTFIKKVVDSNGEDFLSNYGDVYSVGYDKLLNDTVNKLFEYNTNDVDMIEDIYITSRMDFDEFHNGLTDTLGYDGVIAWNKAEGTQAIVFRSNQVKEIFNFKPTESNDIRFSRKTENVINLSNDNELQDRISKSNKSKYDVIKDYLIETFAGQTFTLSDGVKAIMDKSDAKHLSHLSDNKKTATLSKLREIIEKAQFFAEAKNVLHKKFDEFRYYEIKVSFDNEKYDILLNVGHLKFQNEYHIYDITKKGSIANESSTRLARSVDYALKNNASNNSILNTKEKVNTNLEKNKFSYKDSQGNTLSKEQQEFFKDSKVRDKDGNLLALYHGTNNEFYVFDKTKIKIDNLGRGFYFVDKKQIADSYAQRRTEERGGQERVVECYLLAKKPFDISNISDEEMRDFLVYDYNQRGRVRYDYRKKYGIQQVEAEKYVEEMMNDEDIPIVNGKKDYSVLFSTSEANFQSWLKERKYDGLIVAGTDKKTNISGTAYIVFDSNQIKLTTNKTPTSNTDIRFSYKTEGQKQKALEYFGTTYDYDQAGFMLDDGRMLKLSMYGLKGVKHRRIEEIFDDKKGHDAVYDFINDGNIRINASSSGIEIGSETPITRGQINSISRFIEKQFKARGLFYLDITDRDGNNIVSKDYHDYNDESVMDVMWDIEDYYNKGRIPANNYRFSYKLIANYTRDKVYSKKDAEQVINTILADNLGADIPIDIANKNKNEAISILFDEFNASKDKKESALKIANYIVEHSVVANLQADEMNAEAMNTIATLRPYFHNVDLTEVDTTDKAVKMLWGNKEGLSPYQIKRELADNGFILEGETDGEVFADMLNKYKQAKQSIQKQTEIYLKNAVPKENLINIKSKIVDDIVSAYNEFGSKSKFAKIIEQYKDVANQWKNLYYAEKRKSDAEGRLKYEVEKFRDIHVGKTLQAHQYKQQLFNNTIGQLKKLVYRGRFNDKRARMLIGNLAEWYTKDNPIFKDDENFNEDIANAMRDIAHNIPSLGEMGVNILENLEKESGLTDIQEIYEWYTKANVKKGYSYEIKNWLGKIVSPKQYNVTELNQIGAIVGFFRKFIETYNKIEVNDEYVDAMPMAKEMVDIQTANNNRKLNGKQRIFSALFKGKKTNYMEWFGDPMAVARYHDGYNDKGFNQYAIRQMQNAELEMQVKYINIMRARDKFFADKKYLKRLNKTKVLFSGKEISLDNAIMIYMQLNQEDALMGMALGGIKIVDEKGNTVAEFKGFANENDSEDDIKEKAKKIQNEIAKQLTEDDMTFIAIQENLYNNVLRNLKKERDEKRQGYSNVREGYYIPIYRADVFKGLIDIKQEMSSVNSASFNKERTKSQARLLIMPASQVLERHANGVLKYYYFSPIERNLNTIRSLNVSEEGANPVTLDIVMSSGWKDFKDFYAEMYNDIRGVKSGKRFDLFGAIRGNTAKAVLGLNPKVLLNQLSSYPAALHILDLDSVIKGIGVKTTTEDLYKYAPIAEARKYDNSSAKAQGVIEDTSSVFLQGIGFIDGVVVKGVYGACQIQVQKDKGLKIGTVENKKEAGKLLIDVILETQQNTFKSSQTQASRSENDLLKMLVMFRSDIIKGAGRIVDGIGRVLYAQNSSDKKSAHKQLTKSISVVLVQSLYMAGLSLAFAKLYNTDDEDKSDLLTFIADAFGNMLGGFPIISSIIESLTSGYDIEDMSLGTINDIIDAVKGIGKLVDGDTDSQEIANTVRKLIYSISAFVGLPVKNLYKILYGGTNIISPSTAYQVDNIFYKQSYNKDLKKAIESGDEKMISTIAGLIMNENVGSGFKSESAREEINRLLTKGYDVIPTAVGDSMTINDTTYKLKEPDKERFKETYYKAISKVEDLMSSNGYMIASDDAKAKAIKYVYKYYYYESQAQTLDVELDIKLYLFGQIVPIDKMSIVLAEIPSVTANAKNKKQAVQAYLQKAKLTVAEKYILMGYLGYKNTYGESQVKALISKTNLSKKQREILLEKCGYKTS
ncbi:MAG: hypothetical protein IKA85_06720 [Clostridia bacterium]|nr:hypothetical protein [Clostridia bacterium]